MSVATVTSSEFRANMPAVIGVMNDTRQPITVFRNSKPWFEIRPIGYNGLSDEFSEALEQSDSGVVKSYDTPQDLFEHLGI